MKILHLIYKSKRHVKLVLAVSFFPILVAAPRLQADIVDCNGVLTNKPCADGRKVLTEINPTASSNSAQTLTSGISSAPDGALMQRWMNDLEIKKIRYQRKHGVTLELELVRRACLTGPIEMCDQKIKEANRELEERVLRQQEINLNKQSEDSREVPPKDGESTTSSSVTVVNVVPARPSATHHTPKPITASKAVDKSAVLEKDGKSQSELSTALGVDNPL